MKTSKAPQAKIIEPIKKIIEPIKLSGPEDSLLRGLIAREQAITEEIQRLRSSISSIVMVIAGRAGAPPGARLNLDMERGTITVAEV